MKRNRFDNRSWEEIVGDLVSERTTPGDAITLNIKFNGTSRPTVTLKFATFDLDKAQLSNSEEISDWLPEKPYYMLIDDTTGKPLDGEFQRGFPDWRSYVNDYFGPQLKGIVSTGGRRFGYEEEA
jgi:hypothetical protein